MDIWFTSGPEALRLTRYVCNHYTSPSSPPLHTQPKKMTPNDHRLDHSARAHTLPVPAPLKMECTTPMKRSRKQGANKKTTTTARPRTHDSLRARCAAEPRQLLSRGGGGGGSGSGFGPGFGSLPKKGGYVRTECQLALSLYSHSLFMVTKTSLLQTGCAEPP